MRPSLFVFPLSCALLAVAKIVAFTSGGSASSSLRAPASQTAAATTVTQHLVLDSTDFVSQDDTCTLKVGNSHGIGGGPGPCQHWMASVHVPDDSTIVGVKVTYTDAAQFADLFIALHERSLDGQSGSDTAISGQLPDPGNGDFNFASLIGDVPVDNNFDHYDLEMTMDVAGIAFFSAVVTYTEPVVTVAGASHTWADVDCNGAVAPRDGQSILNHFLGKTELSVTPPCPAPGDTVTVS